MPASEDSDSQGQRYEPDALDWLIRAGMVVAVGLNVWLLWSHVADDPQAKALAVSVRAWYERQPWSAQCRRARRKAVAETLWQATEVVEAAAAAADSTEPEDGGPRGTKRRGG